MSKELEAFKEIGKLKENECCINSTEEYKIVEKVLKAFEIIKKKNVLVDCIIGVSLKDYNKSVDYMNEHFGPVYKYLTQEEFDLLKEELL